MILKKISFPAIAFMLSLGFVGCSDDAKKPEETVQPAAAETPATPPETPAPAPAADISADLGSQVIYFAFDDYSLNADAQASLNKVADELKANSAVVVQIEGHTDERGSTEYNLALGERRAQAVKNYLVQLGVDGSRLPTISYGKEHPVAQGHDEAAWSKNRRAQFSKK